MAYNNFPIGYQPAQIYYPQQQYNPMLQTQNASQSQNNSSIIWVQGEAGAKSYMVAPNTTVQLWDSENQVVYLKSADASGMPSMKVLDYKIREAAQPMHQPQVMETRMQEYVTRDELDAFKNQIHEQISELMKEAKNE